MNHHHDNQLNKLRVADSMKSASVRLAEFSRLLFADLDTINITVMSPLIPYSLYEAAIVEFRSWKENKESFCKQRFDVLRTVLGHFRRRWLVAGTFARRFMTLQDGGTMLILRD
jgi:hypothetical protein